MTTAPLKTSYDTVVIGSGHNGLGATACLADAQDLFTSYRKVYLPSTGAHAKSKHATPVTPP